MIPMLSKAAPRNADAAVKEKAMLAKLEQLLAEAKGEAPGEGPEQGAEMEMPEMEAPAEGSATEEACCETCGQPLPMAPHEMVDSADSSVIN